MSENVNENVLEWLKGGKIITATMCQKKYIHRLERLAEKFPNEVQITARNDDGSIVAHFPVRALIISLRDKRNTGDETEDDLPFSDFEDEDNLIP